MTGFRWWLLQVEYCCLFLIFSCGRNWAREAFQGPFYKGTNSSWPNHLPFLISIGLLGRYNQSTTPPIEMTFFSLDFLEMRLFWELSIKLPLNAFSCLSPSRATQPDYRTWASGDPSVWLGEMGTCVLILFFFFPHLRAIKSKTLYAYIPKVHFSLEDAEVETKRSPDNFSNAA